jgi:uncharacterized protein (DUF2164 family)
MLYNTKNLLNALFAQTESHLEKMIAQWQQLPAEFLNAQPGPNEWSAAQCLAHLNSYGRYYLPTIEKAIATDKSTKTALHFKSGWLGNYFYKLMLTDSNGGVKKKMKAPKDHVPAVQLNTAQVVSEFISQLEKLEQLLTLAQNKNLGTIKAPISITKFVKLKLGDVFLFYTTHISRHLLQAEKALIAAGYTASSYTNRFNTILA